jgi:hypothetical protein
MAGPPGAAALTEEHMVTNGADALHHGLAEIEVTRRAEQLHE